MKKGFTLAEILIVLTVIGILTAILLPVAFQSAPDENVMKFKKANSTLGTIVRELINADKYYANGDFGIKRDGSAVSAATYFCESMADILSIKSKNCSNTTNATAAFADANNITTAKANLDTWCKTYQTVGAEIVTSDDVTWYQASPGSHFGSVASGKRVFAAPNDTNPLHKDANGFDSAYKVLCIDVDGLNSGEDPFGFGIRADGRILPGARADLWTQKSVQRGDD